MVVNTETLADNPDFGKALVGAWYETMAVMSGKSKESKEAIAYMAKFAGGTEAEFRAQLRTTAMFYQPEKAAEFARSDKLKETMEHVRQFSFDKGLFGAGAASPDFVGISFPDGSVLGETANVKLRFVAGFMESAAQ